MQGHAARRKVAIVNEAAQQTNPHMSLVGNNAAEHNDKTSIGATQTHLHIPA